jgi:geranylgeranyl reductase family protein
MAAYDLANAGAKVLVLEKERLPRYKACGGGLTQKSVGLLPFDVSSVVEDTIRRVRFTFKLDDPLELSYPQPLIYTVMRDRFDQFLMEKALAAGAQLRDGVPAKGLVGDAELEVLTDAGSFAANVVLGADGVNGIVARSQGLMRDAYSLVALEAEIEPEPASMANWAGTVALDLGSLPGSYAWSFPKKSHLSVGAGGLKRVAKRLAGYYASFVDRQDLGNHHVLSQKGHPLPLRKSGSPVHKGRVALVGDAAGLVDAFTGEGIYWALASGRLAAQAAGLVLGGEAETMAAYESKVNAELMPELIYSRRWANVYLWWPSLCYGLLQRSHRFWNATARIMRGEKTYSSIEHALGPLSFFVHYMPDPTRR